MLGCGHVGVGAAPVDVRVSVQAAQEARTLPTQPMVAAAVLRTLAFDAHADLTGLVEVDPALCVAVLRAANAPHLRMSRRVSTVGQAMVVLGTAAVEAITTSTTASLVLGPGDVGCPPKFWVRSLASAVASAEIATRLGTNSDEAFAAAMLHDLGELTLFRVDQNRSGQASAVTGRTCSGTENRTSAEIGADRLAQWLLPERLVRAVRCHRGSFDATTDTLSRIVWAGVRVGATVVEGPPPLRRDDTARLQDVLDRVGLEGEDPNVIALHVDAEVQRLLSTVRGPS